MESLDDEKTGKSIIRKRTSIVLFRNVMPAAFCVNQTMRNLVLNRFNQSGKIAGKIDIGGKKYLKYSSKRLEYWSDGGTS